MCVGESKTCDRPDANGCVCEKERERVRVCVHLRARVSDSFPPKKLLLSSAKLFWLPKL